jgi:shikimate dehydrogenase
VPTDAPRRAAVLGSPVAHSLSPVLHNAAFAALGLSDWTYERIECDAEGLPPLVSSLGPEWTGLSVTMPGKHAALSVASVATDRAVAVGAANTLVQREPGEWHADCTDVDGVVGALRSAGGVVSVRGGAGIVLGAGGTACAALAGLADLGIGAVSVVVRDPARATSAVACAGRLGLPIEVVGWADADFGALAENAAVLVNTTPAEAISSVVPLLARAPRVLDVIYHPWPTALATAVENAGGHLATGLDMLLHQAFAQTSQFTGRPAPRVAMRDALRAVTGGALPLVPSDDELESAVVAGQQPSSGPIVIEEYNPEWPVWYSGDEAAIRAALGGVAVRVEHVGSTSVPGLPAKPLVDILLLVADPADEAAYVPALEKAGYTLRIREPEWYEHRLLVQRVDDGAPHDINLHVFAPDTGATEVARMLSFRDWLRVTPADRDSYAATKRELAARDWKYVQHYANAKGSVIERILSRAQANR